MAVILRNEHWPVNRKAVQRHMREMGIAGITPGPNPSQRSQAHRVYPYLWRGMKIESKSSNGHRHHIYPDSHISGWPVAGCSGRSSRLVYPAWSGMNCIRLYTSTLSSSLTFYNHSATVFGIQGTQRGFSAKKGFTIASELEWVRGLYLECSKATNLKNSRKNVLTVGLPQLRRDRV